MDCQFGDPYHNPLEVCSAPESEAVVESLTGHRLKAGLRPRGALWSFQ